MGVTGRGLGSVVSGRCLWQVQSFLSFHSCHGTDTGLWSNRWRFGLLSIRGVMVLGPVMGVRLGGLYGSTIHPGEVGVRSPDTPSELEVIRELPLSFTCRESRTVRNQRNSKVEWGHCTYDRCHLRLKPTLGWGTTGVVGFRNPDGAVKWQEVFTYSLFLKEFVFDSLK